MVSSRRDYRSDAALRRHVYRHRDGGTRGAARTLELACDSSTLVNRRTFELGGHDRVSLAHDRVFRRGAGAARSRPPDAFATRQHLVGREDLVPCPAGGRACSFGVGICPIRSHAWPRPRTRSCDCPARLTWRRRGGAESRIVIRSVRRPGRRICLASSTDAAGIAWPQGADGCRNRGQAHGGLLRGVHWPGIRVTAGRCHLRLGAAHSGGR